MTPVWSYLTDGASGGKSPPLLYMLHARPILTSSTHPDRRVFAALRDLLTFHLNSLDTHDRVLIASFFSLASQSAEAPRSNAVELEARSRCRPFGCRDEFQTGRRRANER
jgi:hypothetical protein